MATRTRPFVGLWLTALAFGGLLAGHFLGYAAAAPDAHAREELLAATGHGSHGLVVSVGVSAALAALIGLVVSQVRARGEVSRRRAPLLTVGFALWVLQSAGFTALELFERGGFSHGLEHLAQEPAFLLGLAAQVFVALIAAALVWLVGATVEAILRLLAPPADASAGAVLRPPARTVVVQLGAARRAWNLRGPPVVGRI